MGKKYLDTKENSIESAVMQVWQEAAKLDEYQKINGQFKKVDGGDQRRTENKMKTEKKLDPVGKADDDIDNDGDVDSSDKYLKKRRAAIGKAMKEAKQKPYVSSDRDGKHVMSGSGKIVKTFKDIDLANAYLKKNFDDLMKEGLEDSSNAANSQHLCAKNVVHEEWGEGQPVHGMHAIPNSDGDIAWYDVMFEHGIEKGVSINELKVRAAESHHDHKKKKNEGAMKRGKDMDTFKPKPQNEGTKQVLAHGGKGQYKAVRDGSITKVMYKGKVVGTADFDSGADSFFVSMKGVKGQKSFDDAQAMVDYFAKKKITEELEMRDFNEYQNFKVQSMRDAMEQVWATSAEDKLFETVDLMTEEQYDEYLESLNEEELNELIRAIGRGIKKVATMGTAASRADRAEKKLGKAQARQTKIDTKVANKARIAKAKDATAALKKKNPTVGMKAKAAVGSAAKSAGSAIGGAAKSAGSAIMGKKKETPA